MLDAVGNTTSPYDYSNLRGNKSKDNKALRNSARKIGDRLSTAESKLLNAIDSGNEGDILKAQVEYQSAQRMFAAFTTMAKQIHDTIMSVIRLLRG